MARRIVYIKLFDFSCLSLKFSFVAAVKSELLFSHVKLPTAVANYIKIRFTREQQHLVSQLGQEL